MTEYQTAQEMTRINSYTFYTRLEYYRQLEELISKTKKGDRIAIATMSFEPSEPSVRRIVDKLCKAAGRGVSVKLMVDAHAFMIGKSILPGPLLLNNNIQSASLKFFTYKLELLKSLEAKGGEFTVTNKPNRPFTIPFVGRSHIKFAVINNNVFIGGCNLKSEDSIDLMVRWQQPTIANWLFELAGKVHSQNQVHKVLEDQDASLPIDKCSELLVDAGVKNQSVIYNHALRIIDEAQEYIVMTSQYPPQGKTARHLSLAVGRGVQVRLIHSSPVKHLFPRNVVYTGVRFFEKLKNPPVLFENELPVKSDFLHAKLLATEKACLLGSHNYVQAGVLFGTAEIAILSTEADFAKQAIATLDEQVNQV